MRAAHDCSEGGLAVALAEMAIGGHLGMDVELFGPDAICAYFAESNGRIVLEVAPHDVPEVATLVDVTVLGRVTAAPLLTVRAHGATIECTVDELRRAWGAA